MMLTYKYTTPENEYNRSAQNTTNMECRNFRWGAYFICNPNLRARFPRANKNLSGFPILFRDVHYHNQISVITSTNKLFKVYINILLIATS